MKRDHTTHAPLVLPPLTSRQISVLIDALVDYAVESAKRGDLDGSAEVADEIRQMAVMLQDMDLAANDQMLLYLGLGIARGRPRG